MTEYQPTRIDEPHEVWRVTLAHRRTVYAAIALELRHSTVGYSDSNLRAAVETGLRECPFEDLPGESDFGSLVTFWLTDSDSWEWFPPPLTEPRRRPSTGTWSPARTDGFPCHVFPSQITYVHGRSVSAGRS